MSIGEDLRKEFNLDWQDDYFSYPTVCLFYVLRKIINCEISDLVHKVGNCSNEQQLRKKLVIEASKCLLPRYDTLFEAALYDLSVGVISFSNDQIELIKTGRIPQKDVVKAMRRVLSGVFERMKFDKDLQWLLGSPKCIYNVGEFQSKFEYKKACSQLVK